MAYASVQNIPTRNDTDAVWINWYKDLKTTLSNKQANDVFSRAWSGQNASSSSANTAYLREFMKKNGIEIDGGLIGEFADFGRFGVQQIGDIFTYSKWLSLGLGAIVAVSVGALIFQLATKSSVRREAVDIGTTVATRGLNKV
jgi:hypothetical protein